MTENCFSSESFFCVWKLLSCFILSCLPYLFFAGEKCEEVSPTVESQDPSLLVQTGVDPTAAATLVSPVNHQWHVASAIRRFDGCLWASRCWWRVGSGRGSATLFDSWPASRHWIPIMQVLFGTPGPLGGGISTDRFHFLAMWRARPGSSPGKDQAIRVVVNEACQLIGSVRSSSTYLACHILPFTNLC